MMAFFFIGLPLAGLLYALVIYLKWKSSADPDASFAREYWYTDANPLHRSWWPKIAILIYLVLVAIVGMTA